MSDETKPYVLDVDPDQIATSKTAEDLCEDAAHELIRFVESEEKNAPLLRGLTLKFQKLWNKAYRSAKLDITGNIDRPTKRAINKLFSGK